jgi:RimJ/RimL family protein N-acetyltransferase
MSIDFNIKTNRLILRPISSEDLGDVYPHVTDPEIAKYMSWEPHRNIEQTRKFIERLQVEKENDKSYTWSIFLDNQFCGIVSLIAILRKHRALTYDKAELAYWLGHGFQGKGIMTEACEQVIDFAFTKLKLHRLTVSHACGNKASEGLINRLNFRYIGEEREAFKKNGVWIDHKLYELLLGN